MEYITKQLDISRSKSNIMSPSVSDTHKKLSPKYRGLNRVTIPLKGDSHESKVFMKAEFVVSSHETTAVENSTKIEKRVKPPLSPIKIDKIIG